MNYLKRHRTRRVPQSLPMPGLFGGTDCALPMLYARAQQKEIDTFVIYTDSETWAGQVYPAEA